MIAIIAAESKSNKVPGGGSGWRSGTSRRRGGGDENGVNPSIESINYYGPNRRRAIR